MPEALESLIAAKTEGCSISISINDDGAVVRHIYTPWVLTNLDSTRKNIIISSEEIRTEVMLDALSHCIVTGCYCLVPLKDYRFISVLTHLRDLHIRNGENIQDLQFIGGLRYLSFVYIENPVCMNFKPTHITEQIEFGKCEYGSYLHRVDEADSGKIKNELLLWPNS